MKIIIKQKKRKKEKPIRSIQKRFRCDCDVVFKSDEYTTELSKGMFYIYDYCPLCGAYCLKSTLGF